MGDNVKQGINDLNKAIADLDDLVSELLDEVTNAEPVVLSDAKRILQTDVMQKRMGVIGQRDVPMDRQSYYDIVDAVSTLESEGEDG